MECNDGKPLNADDRDSGWLVCHDEGAKLSQDAFQNELFRGLRALAESSFPKRCPSCGRMFETAEQFIEETALNNEASSGLKQSGTDDGEKIIEVYRTCPCGSTLMDVFADRRDHSDAGMRRRHRFDDMLNLFEDRGIDRDTARTELIKVMRGIKSEVLDKYLKRQ